MKAHYERDLQLVYDLLSAEMEQVRQHVRLALIPPEGADAVIDDRVIDRQEVRIEEECLKTIALHQPVADDLRKVMAIVKVNHELERIADLAESIAKLKLTPEALAADCTGAGEAMTHLAALAERAVDDAIRSFQEQDDNLAKQTWHNDQELDKVACGLLGMLRQRMLDRPATENLLQAIEHVRHTERMADHAASIAKDVIYLVTGEIARHRRRAILGPK